MVDVASLVAIALTGFLLHVVVILFAGSQTAFARQDFGTGELIVEWSGAYRAFPVALSLIWVVLLVPLLVLHPPTASDLPALLALLTFGPAPPVIMIAMTHGTAFRLDETGIRGTYWMRRRQIRWLDVTVVAWRLGNLVIKSPSTTLRINGGMNGLRDLAEALQSRLPRERWADAAPRLQRFASRSR